MHSGPLLFIFYISNMVSCLSDLDFHPPKLSDQKISVLLYAYNRVILTRTPVGLKRVLKVFSHFCNEDYLAIIFLKNLKSWGSAKDPKLGPQDKTGKQF